MADLDETLISRDRSICLRNIEAIWKATEMGVKFVPATGRGYNSVHETLKTLGLYEKENQYTISYNGGSITENKGERLTCGCVKRFSEILFETHFVVPVIGAVNKVAQENGLIKINF